jgi:hypothetical protein
MVAFSTIKPGDVLYSVQKQRMGNTTMKRDAVFPVTIKEVCDGYAWASWNGNPQTRYSVAMIGKLRRSQPKCKPDIFERAAALRASSEGDRE